LLAAAAIAVGQAAAGPVLGGYDVVSYFTDGKAVLGDPMFSFNLTTDDCNTGRGNGTCVPRFTSTFAFISAAHREAFQQDPWKFAPRWGGF